MNKHLIYLGFAAIAVLAGVVSAGTYSGGGNGIAEQPYRIATAADMNNIGAHTEDWGSHFVMVNDVNLAEYTGMQFNIIGIDWYNSFTGVFDGNGHTISNFTYTTTDNDYIGLFGYVDDANVLIKDLTLVTPDVNAAGYSDYVGCLVGRLQSGTISGCGIEEGSVTGDDCAGGLVGLNHSTISNCYAVAGVSGDCFTGGLVGSGYGTISNCYATGSVTGTSHDIGGLVGDNSGTISNCYSVGGVSGGDWTGGLVGYNYGTISASFWDIEIGGPDNGIGTPLPTSQMQTESTFTNAGWDFVDIWDICEGTNYPKLVWQIPLPGDFVCPDGVEINDLDVFMQQWLMEKLSADVAAGGGDGVVDFVDWSVLADGWQNTIDLNDVADFAGQWLQFGAYCADIAPSPDGDGAVDMLDFAVLADNWLEGL